MRHAVRGRALAGWDSGRGISRKYLLCPLSVPLHRLRLDRCRRHERAGMDPAGFTNWFRECCNEAKLPNGLSAHGLRKAACRRLAEAGCTAPEIMSSSGHASLREVQRYIAAADQVRMARAAMEKTKKRTSSVKPR